MVKADTNNFQVSTLPNLFPISINVKTTFMLLPRLWQLGCCVLGFNQEFFFSILISISYASDNFKNLTVSSYTSAALLPNKSMSQAK